METMPLTLDWRDLVLRLLCTAVAGALVGYNRGEHGRPAGLRTTMLVALAAATAMIQANLLLPMMGKAPGSFISNDLMRLPLGILSGMGFIGAGAILRRGELVHGVTTAATLWMVTVVGLCFGGGQLLLGAAGTDLCLAILWGLQWIESRMHQEQRASLAMILDANEPPLALICERLSLAGFRIVVDSLELGSGMRQLSIELRWHGRPDAPKLPTCLGDLSRLAGVASVKWKSLDAPPV